MQKTQGAGAFLRYVIDPKKAMSAALTGECVALALLVGCRAQMQKDQLRYDIREAQLVAAHRAEITETVERAEAEIYATKYMPQENMEEAWPLAQWLDCLDKLYPGITQEAKGLACWGVINRMESGSYPNEIKEVLEQPGQFCEFDGSTPPTEGNVTIASNQLARYYNGDIRPAPPEAVYITVNSEGTVLRDRWEEDAQTRHWRA